VVEAVSHKWIASFVLCLPLSFLPGLADTPTTDESDAAVPARIRDLDGSATIQREREQDRITATVNTPLFPGDRIEVDGGPLEIQLPEGSMIWLDGGARLQILAVQDTSDDSREGTVLVLQEGTLEGDVMGEGGQKSEMRIDTSESSIYLMSRGRFRVETAGGATTVVSYRGVVELAGDEGSALVRSGQQSRVESGGAPEEPWPVNTSRRDAFGEWCEERAGSYVSDSGSDQEAGVVDEVPPPVRHYVSELSYYGDWRYIPTFGWVWHPGIVQVGWRPYCSGYWSWCPRGWTWVSYEPWGWLPYHYGRWSWVTSAGWVWIPGAVYSGAWVSWAVTPSYVGWCPLDFYNRPAYVSLNYTSSTVSQYGGGWNFLPLNRWGGKNLNRDIVRADRVPHLQGAIATRSLPHFDERQARVEPEIVQETVRNDSDRRRPLERNQPGISSFRQADRRESATPRRPTQSRSDPHRGEGKPAPTLRVTPGSAIPRGVTPHREFQSVEPIRPRALNNPRVENPQRQGQPGGQHRGDVKSLPPRVPSALDDPSRRVLNRILKEGNPASTQLPGTGPSQGRNTADRPKTSNGAQPGTGAYQTQTRPPRPGATRPGPVSKPDGGNKQKKDKP